MTGKWFEGGRVRQSGSRKGGTERKRTGVDAKDDDRQHQDYPILVRTQDPSPPDHDTVGDNILSQIPGDSPNQGSVQGCSRNDDDLTTGLVVVHTDVDEEEGAKHR